MEALFHLVFELIKISILGSVYAIMTFLIFKMISKFKPDSWFERVTKKKLKFWFLSSFIISVSLFAFMFTHYGDHGLGDSARIPIGHCRSIQEINGNQAYIQDLEAGISAYDIDKFIITNDFVYGNLGSQLRESDGEYFLYDLEQNKLITFQSAERFHSVLSENELPPDVAYEDFHYYYHQHWSGWRLWLLP